MVKRRRNLFDIILWSLAGATFALGSVPWIASPGGMADMLASLMPLALPLGIVALILGMVRRRLSAIAVTILGLILAAITIGREWAAREDSGPGTSPIVVVTHNLARANANPDLTLSVLLDANADILLLQETKDGGAAVLTALSRHYPWHSKCPGLCDLAIFSRIPIDPVQWKFRDESGRRTGPPLLWTVATLPDGSRVPLVTVHQPWPGRDQDMFRAELIRILGRLPRHGAILAGDFNLTPWSPGMTELDRGLLPMRRITRAAFSFPARIGGMNWPIPFLPIDQLFAGPDWRVGEVQRLDRSGSDHFGLRITLRHVPQKGAVLQVE